MTVKFFDRRKRHGIGIELTSGECRLIDRAVQAYIDSGRALPEMTTPAIACALCRKWIRRGAQQAIATLK